MTRKKGIARRPAPLPSGAEQAIFCKIHDLQANVARQRVRSLEIETHLALARRIAEQDPASDSSRTVIRHLEKMLRVTEGRRRLAEEHLDRLWERLQ